MREGKKKIFHNKHFSSTYLTARVILFESFQLDLSLICYLMIKLPVTTSACNSKIESLWRCPAFAWLERPPEERKRFLLVKPFVLKPLAAACLRLTLDYKQTPEFTSRLVCFHAISTDKPESITSVWWTEDTPYLWNVLMKRISGSKDATCTCFNALTAPLARSARRRTPEEQMESSRCEKEEQRKREKQKLVPDHWSWVNERGTWLFGKQGGFFWSQTHGLFSSSACLTMSSLQIYFIIPRIKRRHL